MSKRLFLLLALMISLALFASACGGGGAAPEEQPKEEPAAEEPAEEEAEEPTEAPAEEEAEAPAEEPATVEGCTDALGCVTVAAGDPIRIASALVIAGPNETLGVDSQTGVEVAIKERGEVAGHTVELTPEDDGCSAEGGQTAATKIASDPSVVAVIGHSCSSS